MAPVSPPPPPRPPPPPPSVAATAAGTPAWAPPYSTHLTRGRSRPGSRLQQATRRRQPGGRRRHSGQARQPAGSPQPQAVASCSRHATGTRQQRCTPQRQTPNW
ncbi:uncharacterized protein [Miscanthus floridulus]|uniref:uncharacterized protein n=1 Tax=Miscanthus floridulus TaxID=154761 RepID=UPI0034578BBC